MNQIEALTQSSKTIANSVVNLINFNTSQSEVLGKAKETARPAAYTLMVKKYNKQLSNKIAELSQVLDFEKSNWSREVRSFLIDSCQYILIKKDITKEDVDTATENLKQLNNSLLFIGDHIKLLQESIESLPEEIPCFDSLLKIDEFNQTVRILTTDIDQTISDISIFMNMSDEDLDKFEVE